MLPGDVVAGAPIAGASAELDAGGGPVTATLSATLEALTSTATGTLPIVGTVAATLGALTLAATGTLPISGSLSATLGALTLAASGTLPITGTVAATLEALTLAATGATPRTATLSVTLGALTLAATNIIPQVAAKRLPSWYYIPGPLTDADPWLRREFERVSQATFGAAPVVQWQVLYAPPEKPRVGGCYYASGAGGWNPGSGEGLYVYKSTGAYVLVG